MTMPVTAADVARHCGVSRHTVGGVLGNRAHRFTAATRAKVEASVAELGYRPNPGSRAMRSGRSHCLALMCDPDWKRTHIPERLLHGLIDAAEGHGMHLAMVRCRDHDLSRQVPRLPSALMADGVIINYHQPVPALRTLLNGLSLPTLWVNANYAEGSISPDDILAGRMATEHLLRAGHRRVAVACAWSPRQGSAPHPSHLQREQGYQEAMQAAGLTPQIIEPAVPMTPGAEARWFTEILASAGRPTALVLVDGSRGIIDAVMGATRAGLRIPADLSVVAIHNEAQHVGEWITTVVLPWTAIAERCVSYLHQRIITGPHAQAEAPAPRFEVPPRIELPTASVAAPGD